MSSGTYPAIGLVAVADNATRHLLSTLNAFPGAWMTATEIGTPPQASATAASICITNWYTMLAYVADNADDTLMLATSIGDIWSPAPLAGAGFGPQSTLLAPAITALPGYNNAILAFVERPGRLDPLLREPQAIQPGGRLLITATVDGTPSSWTPPVGAHDQTSLTAPALTCFGTRLALAYGGDGPANALSLMTSADNAKTWTAPVPVVGHPSRMAPGLTALGDTLVLAYTADAAVKDVMVTTSSNGGQSWSAAVPVGGPPSQTAPAIAQEASTIVVAYAADTPKNEVLATASTDGGKTWSVVQPVAGLTSKLAPALYPSSIPSENFGTGF
jgi:hypothetical protein